MPFKKVHMPIRRITARPGYLNTAMNDTPETRQEVARPRDGANSAMSKPRTSRPVAHRPAGPAARQPAYGEHARSYEQRTGAFQRHRDILVGALPVSQGQVVLDVGCGTGLCSGLLQEKVGPQGSVVGIEESPEMAAVWVAAGGGKWAPWAMLALNLQVRMLHAPYVRSFTGFDRPWNHLEELIEDMHVREVALGSGYIVTGQTPRSRRRRPSGKPRS
jgi:Methyltransferase domain